MFTHNCIERTTVHEHHLIVDVALFQLYRNFKCVDIKICPDIAVVRRTILPSGKIVEVTRCKFGFLIAFSPTSQSVYIYVVTFRSPFSISICVMFDKQ